MHTLTTEQELKHLQTHLAGTPWLIACLCAAWCDTCVAYKVPFQELAIQHPDKCFVWIDIEDQAHLVEDIDIENFPTLLIQHGDKTRFLGTMLPDTGQLKRLLNSFADTIVDEDNASKPAVPNNDWNLRQNLMRF